MSGWAGISPALRSIIERSCTAKEIEVLQLKATGYGVQRMAQTLALSRSAIRDRLRNAERKVMAELAAAVGRDPA